MMYGSFLYNCWAALIGFTIYFIVALQQPLATPLSILLSSFLAAAILFVVTYGVRYLLGYVLFTPEPVVMEPIEQEIITSEAEGLELPQMDQTSAVEFDDESSEEIAKVVRTMMHQEQPAQNM